MSTLGLFKPLCLNGHLRTKESVSKNGTCKACSKDEAKSAKRWLARNKLVQYRKWQKIYSAQYHLKKTFGITLEQYNELLEKQNYSCTVYPRKQENEKRKFAVDHCHKTGRIRGLLCNICNSMIVNVVENYPHLIEAAKEYLNRGKNL